MNFRETFSQIKVDLRYKLVANLKRRRINVGYLLLLRSIGMIYFDCSVTAVAADDDGIFLTTFELI